MAGLAKLWRNVRTAARSPGLIGLYAAYLAQNARAGGPIRRIRGITLGDFNGFSEYHSVAAAMSESEWRFLQRHRFGEGAVLDVGANLGLFSLTVSGLLSERRFLALEPAPSTFEALRRNVARNDKRIECHRLAASDRDGLVRFSMREAARANSSLAIETPLAGAVAIEVPSITLDSFVRHMEIGRIAMLKVDVEGFETAVFRGARELLSSSPSPLVYFEVCPELATANGYAAYAAAAVLEGYGYRMHRILQDGSLARAHGSDSPGLALENWVGIRPQ